MCSENYLTRFKKWVSVHWKALGLILIVALALASVVCAYQQINTPSESPPATSTATSYPLEMGMKLEKTEFQQGELIEFLAYLKNISNRTVHIEPYGPFFDFKITDMNGKVVYQFSRNYGFFGPIARVLEPGVELNYTQKPLVFNETISGVPVSALLSKGTYKATGFTSTMKVAYVEQVKPWGELVGFELIGAVVIETPQITIKIT